MINLPRPLPAWLSRPWALALSGAGTKESA